MASPVAPPTYYENTHRYQNETNHGHVEGGDEKKEGEWVGADHPKLQVQKAFHRWSEIEDTKDATLASANNPPSTYAPEIRPLTPSCLAPEVVVVVRDEKMEVQEEKIYSPEEKIAKPVYTEDKILSPVTKEDGEEQDAKEKLPSVAVTPRRRVICGLPVRRFYAIFGIIVFLIVIVVTVTTSVSVLMHSRKDPTRSGLNTIAPLRNPSMAALSWKDQAGVYHHKVYYQDETNSILEYSWNTSQDINMWREAMVADTTMNVQSGSPLAAAAGWPHANYSYTLVKNVYYVGASNRIYERQAKANYSNAWANDNLSGLYSAANLSSLSVYWAQNIRNTSQALCVLFQEKDAEGSTFSIGKYTSYGNISNDWIETKYNYTVKKGSPLAMARLSDPNDVLVYAVGDDSRLDQYRYNVSTDAVTEFGSTDLVVPPKAAVTVVLQDNTPLYTWAQRPECSRLQSFTHLVLFTNSEASNLDLFSWNCSSGFVNQTAQIKSLLKGKKRIFALASHQNGRVYVRFDAGRGVQIEEWAVPTISGDEWVVTGNVTLGLRAAKNGL